MLLTWSLMQGQMPWALKGYQHISPGAFKGLRYRISLQRLLSCFGMPSMCSCKHYLVFHMLETCLAKVFFNKHNEFQPFVLTPSLQRLRKLVEKQACKGCDPRAYKGCGPWAYTGFIYTAAWAFKGFCTKIFIYCAFQAWTKNIHTKKTLNTAGKHVLHTFRGKHVGLRFWFKHCCPNVFNHGFKGQDVCFPMSGFALSVGLAQLANYS